MRRPRIPTRGPRPALALALAGAALLAAAWAQPAASAPPAQPPAAVALFRKMVDAARTLEVVGTTAERIDLPGVSADPRHQRFALPVTVVPELVVRSFALRLGQATQVAGRRVEALELHGLGPLTPDWTFWVDAATGVRLGYRVVDADGAVVAEGRYSQVREVRVRPTPLALPSAPARLDAQRLARLMDAGHLPRGYVPVGLARTEIGAAKVPALRITFFDGLDALVVLVYRHQDAPPVAAANARLASRSVGRFNVTVVGPAPVASLRSWLDGLERGPLGRPGALHDLQELANP